MITPDTLAILTAPFASHDHEFNRGYIYITEEAICARMETVDPSWEWRISELSFVGGMATVIGALSVCNVTRYGTGQQLAQLDKDSGIEKVGESRKGATTDAMKRAARLFGIGRYLLQCPKEVKDYGPQLNKWLASLQRSNAYTVPAPRPQESAPAKPTAPAWWTPVMKDVKPLMTAGEFDGITAELKAGLYEGRISMDMSETNARLMLHEEFGIDVRKRFPGGAYPGDGLEVGEGSR